MASSTREERQYKYYMQKFLSEQGYPAYADFLDDVIFHLTEDSSVLGYMIMEDTPYEEAGTICVNKNLDDKQMSFVIRHEILHEVLQHAIRLQRMYGGKSIQDIRSMPNQWNGNGFIDNYAGDYEISNLGYTDDDIANARAFKFYDNIVKLLITEDDHPDWVNLSYEEMYDKLNQEMKSKEQEMKQDIQDEEEQEERRSDEYIDGWNQAMQDYRDGKITEDDLEDLIKQLESGGKN